MEFFCVCVTVWYTKAHISMGSGSGWVAVVSFDRGDDGGSNGGG
jgi:hypothetical protein